MIDFSWHGRKAKAGKKEKGLYCGHRKPTEECRVPLKQTKKWRHCQINSLTSEIVIKMEKKNFFEKTNFLKCF